MRDFDNSAEPGLHQVDFLGQTSCKLESNFAMRISENRNGVLLDSVKKYVIGRREGQSCLSWHVLRIHCSSVCIVVFSRV